MNQTNTPKNLVICCDGTGNSFETITEDSNVVKLYSSLIVNDEQRCYYHPGVGTMGAQNSRGRIDREWSRIKGLAFGAGLLDNMGDAYRYLMDTYVDGDKIFLFGFSRGAFTARALASLIHVFGLLCAGNHGAIPYILQMYARRSRQAKHGKITFAPDTAFQWQFSHVNDVRIHFCGLWDTVSSYGWVYDPIQLPFLGSNPIINTGRQSISIDERRCFYQDNLWGEPLPGQDIRQVWFSGVHSDVGGSYPEPESGLSKITLEWMLIQAVRAGLKIDPRRAETVLGSKPPVPEIDGLPKYVQPNNDACIHKSLHGPWWALEVLPHRDPHAKGKGWYLPLGQHRRIPAHSRIHESVPTGNRTPANLPADYQIEPWERFPEQAQSTSA
jgi:uncharacterized protein (DUF2235 family)